MLGPNAGRADVRVGDRILILAFRYSRFINSTASKINAHWLPDDLGGRNSGADDQFRREWPSVRSAFTVCAPPHRGCFPVAAERSSGDGDGGPRVRYSHLETADAPARSANCSTV